jgi:DNA polymerase-3 subunit delta
MEAIRSQSAIMKTPGKQDTISKIRRYYLFHGPNAYKLSERVSSLVNAVISPGNEAFDVDRFDGRQCDIAQLLNVISTPPVLSPLRVVILGDVDKMPVKRQNILLDFLPKVPEYSVLAMTASRADKRSKLFKRLLQEKKQVYLYKEYTPAEAAGLVARFAADREKHIKAQVADSIIAIFGVDPFRLENEIEKICLSIGDKEEIEKRDLAFVSGFAGSETAYDLPGLTFEGRIGEALELCDRAMSSGTNEMQILYIFKNQLARMNGACNLKEIKKLMSLYRMPYPVARQIAVLAGKIGPRGILAGLKLLFRAEYALKSARFPSQHIMELLIVGLYLATAGNKG